MAVTPSVLDFTYKKGNALPPRRIVNYSVRTVPIKDDEEVFSQSNKDWLFSASNRLTSSEIGISSGVNNLSPGIHEAEITFYHKYVDWHHFDPIRYRTDEIGKVKVTLVLTEDPKTEVTPTILNFEYEFDGDIPNHQTINITSIRSWSITTDSNWVSISRTSGVNDATVQISVVPNGLPIGTYTGNLVLDDGKLQNNITVSLVITGADGSDDFLYVTPRVLNFGYTLSGVLPSPKRLELNSSGDWSVSANKPYVIFSAFSGDSGPSFLDIGLTSLNSLTPGDHIAVVYLKNADITKTITVNLTVYEFAEELLSPDQLYYTDENNLIKVSSGRTDTYLHINATTDFRVNPIEVDYSIPFYAGGASKRIGEEAKKIIGELPFIGIGSPKVFSPYKPAMFNFTIKEEELFSGEIIQEIQLPNIRFIKGIKAVNGWLSDLPRKIYLTSSGILAFSFLSNNESAEVLKITGDITKNYPMVNEINEFYTTVFPLSDLSLNIGDVINLSVLNASIQVQIKPKGIDQSFVFWENKWGCFDSFEFTGQFIEGCEVDKKTFSFRKSHNQEETKVVNVESKEIYKVNTGWIYTKEEVQALKKMLQSRNIYLMKENKVVKVQSLTKSLIVSKTDEFLQSFDLKFENVIKS
ncbi:BACON domain-containing protein [Tenacibaculum sp. 190524A02b]|uniref:BACON domain-containing protein n=1 Tax=Tenacibaculum vairaonense TaxID=3137860 RepID=A0ABM9PIR7_9FLAO